MWYTGLFATRTTRNCFFSLEVLHQDNELPKSQNQVYRNPVLYARELQTEMVHDHLTRRQLAERHGISSDRVTQWLCILKLPEEQLRDIEALGDHWSSQVVTERGLRKLRG